jgi:integrase
MGYNPIMSGMRPMTDAEVTRVLAQLNARDRCLFVLGMRTGFRISELLSLTIGDVLQGGEIQPTVAVRRRSMKGKQSGREVPLHQTARYELACWTGVLTARGAAPASPLFPTPAGTAVTRRGAYKLLTRAYRRAGVFGRLGTHTWRKYYAAKMYKNLGENLLKTRDAMGHKSAASTESYLSIGSAEVNAAILAPDDPA